MWGDEGDMNQSSLNVNDETAIVRPTKHAVEKRLLPRVSAILSPLGLFHHWPDPPHYSVGFSLAVAIVPNSLARFPLIPAHSIHLNVSKMIAHELASSEPVIQLLPPS